MKKIATFILALAIYFSMTACGKKASPKTPVEFEISKIAYENINTAYEITQQFGFDIYEAWRLGIYEKDELMENGVAHLADKLSLSEDELRTGGAYYAITLLGEDWDEISNEDKDKYINACDGLFAVMEDQMFTFCVRCVTGAYTINGKIAEAQTALDTAKTQMKELSEKYSDYEHYPSLKGYYTTTNSFFEFCQNPEGSFEQTKNTINDYRNEARDYASDLDYIFED